MATLLLIEDNPDIMKINSSLLTMHGYHVLQAQSLAEANALLETEAPDLLLLDVLLPDGSGVHFCRALRKKSDVPVLFLSALGESNDIINGLMAGGDDYLSKPYDLDVLLAKVKAMLRRQEMTGRRAVTETPPATETLLVCGPLKVDVVAMQATLFNEDLMLTPREYSLLLTLMRQEGVEIPARQLYEAAWGRAAADDTRAVRTLVWRLREKLRISEHGAFEISVERGKGYRFRVIST